jgi:hypothetical protein
MIGRTDNSTRSSHACIYAPLFFVILCRNCTPGPGWHAPHHPMSDRSRDPNQSTVLLYSVRVSSMVLQFCRSLNITKQWAVVPVDSWLCQSSQPTYSWRPFQGSNEVFSPIQCNSVSRTRELHAGSTLAADCSTK